MVLTHLDGSASFGGSRVRYICIYVIAQESERENKEGEKRKRRKEGGRTDRKKEGREGRKERLINTEIGRIILSLF